MTTYVGLRKKLIQEGAKQLVPVVGEFELTGMCNLKCTMCYIPHLTKKQELTTDEWKAIFLDAVKEGMLYALLTGGELFLRRDFEELYVFLYDLGVRITLFTNATLVTREIMETLSRRPPEIIAVTLYGSNNRRYFEVTKDPIGFDKANNGIQRLKEANLPLILRTLPLRTLQKDVEAMIAYAKELDLLLGYTLYLGPNRNTKEQPEDRLSAIELVTFEDTIRSAFGISSFVEFEKSDSGFTCAALRSSFFITYQGVMQPCAMMDTPSRSIKNYSFLDAWNTLTNEVKTISTCSDCDGCVHKVDCVVCMAKRYLEGDISSCSGYLKELAIERKKSRYGKV